MPPENDGNASGQGAGGQGAGGQGAGDQGAGDQGGGTLNWEGVLAGLPEAAQGLFAAHVQGLKGALDSERGQRKDLAKQLQDATAKLEKGSETRDVLEKMSAALERATRQADFVTAAVGQGVRDVRLAWLAAVELDAFNRNGEPDFVALRATHPALFEKVVTKGNAGAGTGGDGPTGGGMNAFIRAGAGRG